MKHNIWPFWSVDLFPSYFNATCYHVLSYQYNDDNRISALHCHFTTIKAILFPAMHIGPHFVSSLWCEYLMDFTNMLFRYIDFKIKESFNCRYCNYVTLSMIFIRIVSWIHRALSYSLYTQVVMCINQHYFRELLSHISLLVSNTTCKWTGVGLNEILCGC